MGELGNDFGARPTTGYQLPGWSAELERLPLSAKRGLFDSYQSWLGTSGAADTTGSLTTFSFEETARRIGSFDPGLLARDSGATALLEPMQNLHEELPYRFAADAGALRSALLSGEPANPVDAATEVERAFEAGKGMVRRALEALRDTVVSRGEAALEGKVDGVIESAERRLAETGHTLYQGTRSLLGVNEGAGEAAAR